MAYVSVYYCLTCLILLVSILFNLLLASITILLCFFFFFFIPFNIFFIIPVAKEKIKIKVELTIPACVPTIFTCEVILIPPLIPCCR